jgi:hypothetical protein
LRNDGPRRVPETKDEKEQIMGNRALVILTDEEEASPVVSLHWHGGDVSNGLKNSSNS